MRKSVLFRTAGICAQLDALFTCTAVENILSKNIIVYNCGDFFVETTVAIKHGT